MCIQIYDERNYVLDFSGKEIYKISECDAKRKNNLNDLNFIKTYVYVAFSI